ncbi:MAG: hypothetical protein Q9187_002802 [Circinaria calcarea]
MGNSSDFEEDIEDLADHLDLKLDFDPLEDFNPNDPPSPKTEPYEPSPESLRRQNELLAINNSIHRLATPRGHARKAIQQQQQSGGSQSSAQASTSNQATGTTSNPDGVNLFQAQGFTASTTFDFSAPSFAPSPFAASASTDKGKGKATEPPVDPKWKSVPLEYGTQYRLNSDDPDKKLSFYRDPALEVAPQWAASSPYHHSKTPAIDALTGSTAAQDSSSSATGASQNATQPQQAQPSSNIPGLFANTGPQAISAFTPTFTAQKPTQSAPGVYSIQQLPQKNPGDFGLSKPNQSTSDPNSSGSNANSQSQSSSTFTASNNGEVPHPFGKDMAKQTQQISGSNSSVNNTKTQPQPATAFQKEIARLFPPSNSNSTSNNTNNQPQASTPVTQTMHNGQETQSSSNPFAKFTSQPQTQTPSPSSPFASNNGQQSQPMSSVFSQPTNQQQTQSTFNGFGNNTNHSQGQAQSPTGPFSQSFNKAQQSLPTSSLFGHSANQRQQTQPGRSIFDRVSGRQESQTDSEMGDESMQNQSSQQNSNAFGQSSNQQSSSNMFGQTSSQQQPSVQASASVLANQKPLPTLQANSTIFSNLVNQKPLPSFQPSSSGFGQTSSSQQQSQPSSNFFGQNTNQQQQSVQGNSEVFNQFPNQQQQPQANSSVFGQFPNQQQQSQPSSSVFGQNVSQQQQSQPSSSVFGQFPNQQQQSQPSPSVFGQNTNQQQQPQVSSSFFGQFPNQQQQSQPSPSVFGQNANQQQLPQASRSIFDRISYQPQATQSPSMVFNQPAGQQQQPQSGVGSFNQPSMPQQPQLAFSGFGQNTYQPQADQSQGSYGTINNSQAQPQQVSNTTSGDDAIMVSPPDSPPRQSQTLQNQAQIPSISQTISQPQNPVPNLGQSLFSKQNKPGSAFSNLTPNKSKKPVETAASRSQGILATPTAIDRATLLKSSIKHTQSSSSPFTATTKAVGASQASRSTEPVVSGSSTATPRKAVQFTPKVSTAKPASKSGDITGPAANKQSVVPAGNAVQSTSTTLISSLIPSNQDQLTTLIPPTIPNHFSEGQIQSFVVGYRLRSLDVGLKKHVMQTDSFSADSLVMGFHAKTKEAILEADASPLSVVGVKRRSIDGRTDEPQPQAKRINVNGPVSDGPGAKRPMFNLPSSKRKADEIATKESANGTVDSGKKARGNEEVSYPALRQSEESKTSKMFASIANDVPNKPIPKPFPLSSSITTSSSPTLGGSSTGDSSNKTTSSVNPKSNKPISFVTTPTKHPVLTFSTAMASLSAETNPSTAKVNLDSSSSISSSGPSKPPVFSVSSSTGSSISSNSTNPPAFQVPKFGAISSSAGSGVSSSSTNPPAIQVPKFGAIGGSSFMAQFGKKAEEDAQKEKAKRKAEEFDSDEDDEAEWERQDAEKQRAKKQKLEETAESAKNNTFKFNAIKTSSISGQSSDSQSTDSLRPNSNPGISTTPEGSPVKSSTSSIPITSTSSKSFGESVFSNANPSGSQSNVREDNIFGKYSNPTSDIEGSKTGNADDEESDVSDYDDDGGPQDGGAGLKPSMTNPFHLSTLPYQGPKLTWLAQGSPKVASRSLFDRIEKDGQGNPKRDTEPAEEKNSEGKGPGNPENPFTKSSDGQKTSDLPAKSTPNGGSNLFGQQSSSGSGFKGFGASTSSFADKTWKPESPIKFRDADVATSPSDTVTTPKTTLTEQKGSPASGFTSLFGAPKPGITDTSGKSLSNIFGNTPTKAPSSIVGFGFGGPPKPFTANSLAVPTPFGSNATSRATSPGATTGGESANESNAEAAEDVVEHHEQVNLTAGPEEQEESNLFEVEAKAFELDAEKKWVVKGVGRLKVMKHRQSSKTRILMRMNPGGKIILNAALMSNMTYEHVSGRKKDSVRFGAATGAGNLTSWLVQPSAMEDAEELAKVLEENKSN